MDVKTGERNWKGLEVLLENSGVTRIWKNCERSTSVYDRFDRFEWEKSVIFGTSTLGVMGANRDREEEIFNAARELAAHERAAFLAEKCAQDADLRQRIEGMLEADAAAGESFKTHDAPAPTVILADANLSPSIEKPGDRTSLDIDTRSDIYSLGVQLYELLTGKTPFDAMNQELQAAAGPKLRLLPGHGFPLCQERRTLIVQGFQKEQLARFESCAPQTGHQPRAAGMHSPPPFVISY